MVVPNPHSVALISPIALLLAGSLATPLPRVLSPVLQFQSSRQLQDHPSFRSVTAHYAWKDKKGIMRLLGVTDRFSMPLNLNPLPS